MGFNKGFRERPALEDRSRKRNEAGYTSREGEVMHIAEESVVSTHPANNIRNVAKLMQDHDFRRIPVTDAGTMRLEGMAKAMDIIDFLGGGEKYNIITQDYGGNFLSAINCPISKIMSEAAYLEKTASVEDAVNIMLDKKTSSIPLVEDEENMKVIAIVTERDVLPSVNEIGIQVQDVMHSDPVTASPGMMLSDVSKVMVRNQLRRLPVIQEDKVIGVVTQFDVLGFLSKGEFKGVYADENLSTRVKDVMTTDLVGINPSSDLAQVAKRVNETGLGGFPVITENKLKGIITTMDVIKYVYGK